MDVVPSIQLMEWIARWLHPISCQGFGLRLHEGRKTRALSGSSGHPWSLSGRFVVFQPLVASFRITYFAPWELKRLPQSRAVVAMFLVSRTLSLQYRSIVFRCSEIPAILSVVVPVKGRVSVHDLSYTQRARSFYSALMLSADTLTVCEMFGLPQRAESRLGGVCVPARFVLICICRGFVEGRVVERVLRPQASPPQAAEVDWQSSFEY